MPGPNYRAIDPELSQGDIVDDVPHLRLRAPLEIIRPVTMRGDRRQYAPFPFPSVEGKTPDAAGPGKTIILDPFHVKEGELVPVLARFTRGIVLNYDCDLVHDEDHCSIAVVRPMSAVHEDDRQTIRENRNFSFFYLPADAELVLEEAYVDLRQVTCLEPDLVESLGSRRASLSPTGLKALQSQIFRHLTRRDILDDPQA